MKNTKIKETVARGLSKILLSLSISKPSGKTRNLLKKITKRISKQLKADVKKAGKKKSKKNKTIKVVKAKPTVSSKKPVRKRTGKK